MNRIEEENIPEYCSRGYIQVDLDAIAYNVHSIKSKLAPSTKIMGVIKTDGYGHGSVPIAHMLEQMDFIWGFATATVGEIKHWHVLHPVNETKWCFGGFMEGMAGFRLYVSLLL